jgi:DNA-binding MarR family transcriptional regulator
MWALAHEPSTPTALARALGASQPLISKHLAILRAAGLVEARRDPHDHRARVYDIRREQLVALHAWLNDIQTAWHKRRFAPDSHHYFERPRLDPEFTTRGTPRQRIPRALKDPWER